MTILNAFAIPKPPSLYRSIAVKYLISEVFVAVTDYGKQTVKKQFEEFGQTRVDVAGPLVTYRGSASHDALTSDPSWQIARVSIQGKETVTEYADNGDFDQIWDDRASLFSAVGFNASLSMYFDGVSDYVNLGTPALLTKERTDAWTWSFWVKPRVLSSQVLYAKRAGLTSPGISISLDSSGRINAQIYNAAGAQILLRSNTGSIIAGTWYNVTVTYAGTSLGSGLIIYLNGSPTSTSPTNDTLGTNSIATTAAASFGQVGNANFLDGYLDEVSFWSGRVLTPAEIQLIWNDSEPLDLSTLPFYEDCTSWWRMGEIDENPNLYDVKGQLNGTMVNMSAANIVNEAP